MNNIYNINNYKNKQNFLWPIPNSKGIKIKDNWRIKAFNNIIDINSILNKRHLEEIKIRLNVVENLNEEINNINKKDILVNTPELLIYQPEEAKSKEGEIFLNEEEEIKRIEEEIEAYVEEYSDNLINGSEMEVYEEYLIDIDNINKEDIQKVINNLDISQELWDILHHILNNNYEILLNYFMEIGEINIYSNYRTSFKCLNYISFGEIEIDVSHIIPENYKGKIDNYYYYPLNEYGVEIIINEEKIDINKIIDILKDS